MRNQKGITLIALIVTIIVLIIIAGISIATLTADNGILRQVDSAKVAQIEGTAKEEVDLAMSALRIAIAQAQANDNSYRANRHGDKIQSEMLRILNADTQLSDKSSTPTTAGNGWTTASVATEKSASTSAEEFTIQYTGDDYQNACNNDSAKITYTISLTQSSIDCVMIVADGITSGSSANSIKPTDIGANALVNGLR